MDVLAGSAAAITIVGDGSRSVRSDIRRPAVSAARRSSRLPAADRAAGTTVADGGLAHNAEASESFMAAGVSECVPAASACCPRGSDPHQKVVVVGEAP